MSGNHFITPSPVDCSMTSGILCKNWLQFKEDINGYISPNTIGSSKYDNEEYKYTSALDINIYKYFFNKAKYSRDTFDFIDTIISSSVSLESFIHYILRLNIDNEKDIEKYTKKQGKNKKNQYYNIYKLIKKMNKDKYISLNESIDDNGTLSTLIGAVLDPRNDLMHGKLVSIIGLDKKAIESCDALIKLYENVVIKVSKEDSLNSEDNRIRLTYNDIKAEHTINEALNMIHHQERIIKLEESIQYKDDNAITYLAMGDVMVNTHRIDEGIEFYQRALEKTHIKDEIYFNLGLAFYIKRCYKESLKYFELINHAPINNKHSFCKRRYYRKYGECYLAISQDDNQLKNLELSKEEALKEAIKQFQLALSHDNNYSLVYYDLGTAYFELGEFSLAIKAYTRVLQIDTKYFNAYVYRAYSYLYTKNDVEFRNDIESLFSLMDEIEDEKIVNDFEIINISREKNMIQITNLLEVFLEIFKDIEYVKQFINKIKILGKLEYK